MTQEQAENLIKAYGSKASDLAQTAAQRMKGVSGIGVADAVHIRAYTNGLYGELNSALRSDTLTAKQAEQFKGLKAALEKLPAYVGDTKRGAHLGEKERNYYKPGMVVQEKGFASTTSGTPRSGNTQFIVSGKTGRDVSKLSQYPGEKEVLYPPTWFEVTKHEQVGKSLHIHLREI
jgi:hypothetical protein